MLSGQSTIATYSRTNLWIWMTMALQAGIINIGGFMACHRFVSHVTGFSTFMGIELSQRRILPALGMLAVPIFYLMGSFISGKLVDLPILERKTPRYGLSFGLISFGIGLVWLGGIADLFGVFGQSISHFQDYVLIALLCLSCGIQNGLVTSVSKAVIRTTHLTGITTDLGIGLARVFFSKKNKIPGFDSKQESQSNLIRMGLIGAFSVGSILGGLLFTQIGYQGFLIPTLISATLTLTFLGFRKTW